MSSEISNPLSNYSANAATNTPQSLKKLKTYQNNEKNNKMKPKKKKKTHLFSWKGRLSTETTSKGSRSFFEA